jgi:hypothetical protein
MKIGYVTHGTPAVQSASPRKTTLPSSGFEKVFNESLQRQEDAERGAPTVLQTLSLPASGVEASVPFNATAGMQAMDDLIDALEGYQQQLADPDCCLRDIAPSLERLENAHRHLARLATGAPADSTLGNIMNEGLVTATMEIQRFHSGVYC